MKLNSLHELLVSELNDLLSAERQLQQIIPKIIKRATNPKLKESLEAHLKETNTHEGRLQECFKKLEIPVRAGRSHGMIGLISGWMEVEAAEAQPDVMDAAIVSSVQRMEHYEIAGYGCAHAFAEVLEETEVASLLLETLREEEQCDRDLTLLAQSVINAQAEVHSR